MMMASSDLLDTCDQISKHWRYQPQDGNQFKEDYGRSSEGQVM
jgi:hypothetical protein